MTRRSVRRSLCLAGALVVTFGLSSCATFENQNVATVDDQELSQDDLESILNSDLTPVVFNGTEPVVDGLVGGDTARGIVSVWITLAALRGAGLIADDQIDEVTAGLASDQRFSTSWADAPAVMQELVVWYTITGNALTSGELDREAAITAIQDTDIAVDSFYGAWDNDQLAVVAFG